MKVVLNTKDNFIIKTLEKAIRDTVTLFYGWIFNENTEILGYVLGVLHITLGITLFILILVCHTVYPVFWAKCVIFFIFLIIWLQHIFLQVCVMTVAERILVQDSAPFNKFIKSLLRLDTKECMKILMIIETVTVIMLGLEITNTLSLYLFNYFGVYL